jgi:NAD(P)-dependent dehydrogenase (short-subunit alcohol dehydrogenase family)
MSESEELRSAAPLLAGRVAILSAVTPEPGRAIARSLAREGANLLIADDRPGAAEACASEIRAAGSRAAAIQASAADAEACRRVVEEALRAFGRLDVLVVNPAFERDAGEPIAEADLAAWRVAIGAEVSSALALAQAVVPAMRSAQFGSIVLIGAEETRLAPERAGSSTLARAALLAAAQVMARELGPYGIRVNTVVPGRIDSLPLDASVRERLLAEHALGRFTRADEVADAVVFFASDLSRIVTGQSLDVNCGHYFH